MGIKKLCATRCATSSYLPKFSRVAEQHVAEMKALQGASLSKGSSSYVSKTVLGEAFVELL